jgi:caffeoyl-CoA O-methyltransferase
MADQDSRSGHTYHPPSILEYVARVHAAHDAGLEAAFTAPGTTGLPAIQVGPSEGKLVGMLASLIGAKKIVEIGTLAGYSGIWLARALPPGGVLVTLENDPAAAAVAAENFARAGVADRVRIVVGDAVESLPSLTAEGPFCMVFVDADKARYDQYGRWARENLRPGGLLIGDNAFFFGELLDTEKDAAMAMRIFHEEMAEHFDSVCIPTPDGLAVGRRR